MIVIKINKTILLVDPYIILRVGAPNIHHDAWNSLGTFKYKRQRNISGIKIFCLKFIFRHSNRMEEDNIIFVKDISIHIKNLSYLFSSQLAHVDQYIPKNVMN